MGKQTSNPIRNMWKGINLLYLSVCQDICAGWFGAYLPLKPTILQYLANDICNSRCAMCNIWQHNQDHEINIEELHSILADPLFCETQFLEITGGEPTLRSDLPEIGQIFVKSLPKLRSVQINTNALNPLLVLERIMALAQVIHAAGIQLQVSVSIDGIGSVHDRNRGMQGNFVSAMDVIQALLHNKIPVSVNCTLTSLNCYRADDVLLWCEQNGIQDWVFRVGVEVKRFDNEGYSQRHPFTSDQGFHVAMFFDKLARYVGVDLLRRLFYKSLADQLSIGLPRSVNCHWQTRAIALDMQGNLSYCPPQSPILGSVIEKSSLAVYEQGKSERQRIIRDHCTNCQYDSVSHLTTKQIVKRAASVVVGQWQKKIKVSPVKLNLTHSVKPAERNTPKDWRRVLITGWYGTETTGDKAILGELLHFIKGRSPDCEIVLTTLDKKISQQTNLELEDLTGVKLVEIENGHNPALIESVDAVIVGGGPLMQTRAMEFIWRIFAEANRQRKARVVFGCGIGPLNTEEMHLMTAQVLQMSTAGFFRDEESYEYALKLAPDGKFGVACDPALAYLKRWLVSNDSTPSQNEQSIRISTLLRANTSEFIVDLTKKGLEDFNTQSALKISKILETVCESIPAKATLLAMNAPWIGGDDRMFNRLVAGSFTRPDLVQVERGYFSLDAIIQSLATADAAIAMRYHGHLFCMMLGIPFLSIDYTGKSGKVFRLVKRIGYEQWSESWREIDIERSATRLQELVHERAYWSAYLKQQSEGLVNQLQSTYSEVFG
jgi:polysaccharide pyruvyl transferase WcaK-like protein/MoaA/NifB/PqqE/SkfB family radical SAM enzyme